MLMITSFTNPRVAQAFVDYMATQGIILTIQQHTQSDIWLADEKQADRVQKELARFLENPADPRYLAASWQTGQTNSGLHYQRFPFLATLKSNAGPFTLLLMAVCIATFILMNVIGDQAVMIELSWPYDASVQFEVWRYFTHAFMHFSIVHILFNLLWWWYIGGMVERRLGSGKLIVITIISTLLSGFVQHQFSGPWFGGMSGVVYALMGYTWLRGERQPESGVYLQRGLILFSLVWLMAGWFNVFGMEIANGAHVAGLVTGLAMAYVDTHNVRKRT